MYRVLLEDGTTGWLDMQIGYDLEEMIGEEVTIHLQDENGNKIEVEGILDEILE